jgi:hypothetical protein
MSHKNSSVLSSGVFFSVYWRLVTNVSGPNLCPSARVMHSPRDWPHSNNILQLISLLLHYILHCPPLPEPFILSRLEIFQSLLMDLPSCQNYFRIKIVFEFVAAKILLNFCQRMTTARSPIRLMWGIFKDPLVTELNTTQNYFLDQALPRFHSHEQTRVFYRHLPTAQMAELGGQEESAGTFLFCSHYLTRIHLLLKPLCDMNQNSLFLGGRARNSDLLNLLCLPHGAESFLRS